MALSVFAKNPAIRIARSISGKLMLWKRAIRIGKKCWRRFKHCAKSQKKRGSFAPYVTVAQFMMIAWLIAIVFVARNAARMTP
jgi:hypothetical protein